MSTMNCPLPQQDRKTGFSRKALSAIAFLCGCLFFALAATPAFAATSQWIWMGGGANTSLAGIYGTPGVAASGIAPGARTVSSTWTDKSGNLWLFGGYGYDSNGTLGDLNDLWMYNPNTLMWTYVAGYSAFPGTTPDGIGMAVSASPTMPGGREGAASWTDSSGDFWLFGGKGWDVNGNYGELNDLWEFTSAGWNLAGGPSSVTCNGYETGASWTGCGNGNVITNMTGAPDPGNWPGGRQNATTWADPSGSLWLFGGGGFSAVGSGELSDLWEYVPGSGWAWMSGNQWPNQPTNSGGTAPGGRDSAISLVDSSGNLWLFGGNGVDSVGNSGILNDLWELVPATGCYACMPNWTLVGGSITSDSPANNLPLNALKGQYGTPGTAGSGNQPGRRIGATAWTDSNHNFWLLGGSGYDSSGSLGLLSDLWEYTPPSAAATGGWTWVSGSKLANQASQYGSLEAAGAGDAAGGRNGSGGWVDSNGNLWLYGGQGVVITPSGPSTSLLNELWVFQTAAPQPTAMPFISPGTGNYWSVQAVTITDSTPGATIYYTTDGSTPTTSSSVYSVPLTVSASETVNVIAVAPLYAPSGVAPAIYTMMITADPVILPASGIYTGPQTVIITDATPGAVIYFTTDGSNPTPSSPVYTGLFQVSANTGIYAMAVFPGYSWSNTVGAFILFSGQAATPFFNPPAGTYTAANVTIGDSSPGVTIYYTVDGTTPTTSSPVYGAPIPVTGTETIQAIAAGGSQMAGGGLSASNMFSTSSAASATYSLSPAAVQSGLWTWMNGNSGLPAAGTHWESGFPEMAGQPGSYGNPGIAAEGNTPGGRDQSVRWTDSAGNLWLFGGAGYDSNGNLGLLNDLWEYNLASGYWAWMGGNSTTVGVDAQDNAIGQPGVYASATPTNNVPGGRSCTASWTDHQGNFWLLGGLGNDSNGTLGYLNDLWKYVQASGTWVWAGGNSTVPGYLAGWQGSYGTPGQTSNLNMPGGRACAQSWTDPQGNFWLFGGWGADVNGNVNDLNDLWEYVPGSGWAWISGSSSGGINPGSFGTKGVANSNNVPSSRDNSVGWTDANGNLWLLGGMGVDKNGTSGYLNDLWEYSPAGNLWTWVSGNATLPAGLAQQLPVISKEGVFAPQNTPSSGFGTTWTDKAGNLWLFGGGGWDFPNVDGELESAAFYDPNIGTNTLWVFNPNSREWAWINGTPPIPTPLYGVLGFNGPGSVYGTPGVPAAGNAPGTRDWAAGWSDNNGNLWLFGGVGFDAIPGMNEGYLNDLWEFQPGTIATSLTPTTTTLVSSLNPSVYGQPVTFTATVTSTAGAPPDGTVTFSNGATTLCTNTPLTGGSAQCPASVFPAGTYPSIAATYSGDATFGPSASASLSQTVNQAPLTITASSASVNYGDSVPTITPSYSGWMNGDSSSSLSTAPSCATAYTATSDPGTYSTSCSGAVDSNYAFTYVAGTITVSKATPIVTTWPTASPITYGQTLASSTLSGGTASVPGGFSWTNLSTAPNAGTQSESVTFTPSNTKDYNMPAAGLANVTVNQAPQIITFTDGMPSTVDYYLVNGEAVFTISASGGASGNSVNLGVSGFGSLRSVVSGAGNTSALLTITNIGKVVVTATQTGNTNYLSATAVTQTFVFQSPMKTPQFVSFTALPSPVTYGVGPIPLSATATSGLGVTFSVLSGPGHTSGSNLIITGVGTVVVAANQAGNGTYAAAQATQQVVVHPATPVITWANPVDIVYGVALSGKQLDAKANVAGKFTYTPAAGTILKPGLAQTLSVSFGPSNTTDYTSATASVTLNVDPATLTVTAKNASMTYGGNLPTFTYGITGFVDGDTAASVVTGSPSLTTAANLLSPPGTYPINVSAGTLVAANNYVFAFKDGTLTVKPAVLVEAATNLSMAYGSAVPPLTYTLTGFLNGDNQALATTGTPLLSTTATPASIVGSYPIDITAGTLAATNYSFTFRNGTLRIAKATPTIIWPASAAIPYGTALSALQQDATSTVVGSFAYNPVAGTVLGGGTHTLKVTFTPTDTVDYATAAASVSLLVNPALQTITFTQPTTPVTYGVKPMALSATSASGLKVSFSMVSGPATVSGSRLTILGAGTVVVEASQAGNTDYAPATPVQQTIQVNQANPTISLTESAKSVKLGAPVTFTATLTGAGIKPTGTVTFTVYFASSGDPAIQPLIGAVNAEGVVTITTVFRDAAGALIAGNFSITANYGGDANYLPASSAELGLTVANP